MLGRRFPVFAMVAVREGEEEEEGSMMPITAAATEAEEEGDGRMPPMPLPMGEEGALLMERSLAER
jgi:hypothetical protein